MVRSRTKPGKTDPDLLLRTRLEERMEKGEPLGTSGDVYVTKSLARAKRSCDGDVSDFTTEVVNYKFGDEKRTPKPNMRTESGTRRGGHSSKSGKSGSGKLPVSEYGGDSEDSGTDATATLNNYRRLRYHTARFDSSADGSLMDASSADEIGYPGIRGRFTSLNLSPESRGLGRDRLGLGRDSLDRGFAGTSMMGSDTEREIERDRYGRGGPGMGMGRDSRGLGRDSLGLGRDRLGLGRDSLDRGFAGTSMMGSDTAREIERDRYGRGGPGMGMGRDSLGRRIGRDSYERGPGSNRALRRDYQGSPAH